MAVSYNLGDRELASRIKNKEYNRLPIDTRNKITNSEPLNVKDLVPNPILIRNRNNIDVINEKALHNLILEDIELNLQKKNHRSYFFGTTI